VAQFVPEEDTAEIAMAWHVDAKEQVAGRFVSIPEAMTLKKGLSALRRFSERELARAAESRQKPLALGPMLMLRR
jgi:hypothetical protein